MALRATNSPLSQQQADLVNQIVPSLAADQITWLCGYLAGVQEGQQAAAPPSVSAPAARGAEVTVLFGSQTGNSQRVAKQLNRRLQQCGLAVTLSCMSEYPTRNLKKARHLLVVASTHGEGDPPDKALTFFEFLKSRRAPRLEGTRYSVLALGDLTYKHFCKAGKDLDARLAELGAERLHPRMDCDVEYFEPVGQWIEAVVTALASQPQAAAAGATLLPALADGRSAAAPAEYGRGRPFAAEVLENLNLNGRGSDKETRQFKVSLADSGICFEPGDSLGIYPQNRSDLVESLMAEMGWNADEPVPVGKAEKPLREALTKDLEITALTRPLLEQAAAFSRDGLKDLVARSVDEEIFAYLDGRDLLDLVRDFSLRGAAAKDFVPILRKLPPRLYSIASSQQANPDELDLIMVVLRYQSHGRERFGACSNYCAERVGQGDRVHVFVHSNPNFRMPVDADAPMIMIGPGTGVAPFRAFLEQREEVGASGKNWLFFGDRRFRTDFLCQVEWLRWINSGLLTHMDVAFSRELQQKVYVQHRMLENSREIFAWLEQGAYVYVCGDEKRMAPDVHAALESIIAREGGMNPDQARSYLAELQRLNRYQRDVY
ncbi:MAG: assimilatory sulfite reductase (NADPH) flavoprotein subunit [Thermoguttaceae bacterium]|jgi:sulfite reductase (NADPH) flavoprotein alpha-component